MSAAVVSAPRTESAGSRRDPCTVCKGNHPAWGCGHIDLAERNKWNKTVRDARAAYESSHGSSATGAPSPKKALPAGAVAKPPFIKNSDGKKKDFVAATVFASAEFEPGYDSDLDYFEGGDKYVSCPVLKGGPRPPTDWLSAHVAAAIAQGQPRDYAAPRWAQFDQGSEITLAGPEIFGELVDPNSTRPRVAYRVTGASAAMHATTGAIGDSPIGSMFVNHDVGARTIISRYTAERSGIRTDEHRECPDFPQVVTAVTLWVPSRTDPDFGYLCRFDMPVWPSVDRAQPPGTAILVCTVGKLLFFLHNIREDYGENGFERYQNSRGELRSGCITGRDSPSHLDTKEGTTLPVIDNGGLRSARIDYDISLWIKPKPSVVAAHTRQATLRGADAPPSLWDTPQVLPTGLPFRPDPPPPSQAPSPPPATAGSKRKGGPA